MELKAQAWLVEHRGTSSSMLEERMLLEEHRDRGTATCVGA